MANFEETRQTMRELVLKANKISSAEFEEKIELHHQFLNEGGAGGYWETFYIDNLIFGTYMGITTSNDQNLRDKQANLCFYDLNDIDLLGVRLQYANCAGIKAEAKSWNEADLEGSLLIDSVLPNCSFQYADLYAADFSRSDMRNCDFRGASLIETDFENCDLSGCDFRGAQIDHTTKFKNAILRDAIFDKQS
ncbi:MAG: pentapeptide repeat-containing protein [Microscillaceae bacterium]|jgi:hypothetical protein|nr:pentapeptide repeat-containing protein [Microscillaceae bacterium]